MKLQSEVIKPGMLSNEDEGFIKKSGLILSKSAEKVWLGGNEAEFFSVAEIHNMRMTVMAGAPALIFHQVPLNGDRPQTWVLSFPSHISKEHVLLIQKADELRAIAKAIVSGCLGDLKRGFLEKTYDDYDDTSKFPVFAFQKVVNWPAKFAAAQKQIQDLALEKQTLLAELNQFKAKAAQPLQTQTDPDGPPKPPPRPLPDTIVVTREPKGNKWWQWAFMGLLAIVVIIVIALLVNSQIKPQ
ncbi:MAG: hypothetical protein U1F83_10350 [Verrucomicrobiota bacterium]